MTFRALLFAALVPGILAPSAAQALSCRAANADQVIDRMLGSGSNPTIIIGFPTKIEKTKPEVSVLDLKNWKRRREPETATYHITGVRVGADRAQQFIVSFTNRCSGPWCGQLPRKSVPMTFLLHEKEGALQGITGPCGGSVFLLPTPKQHAALIVCISEEKCDPNDHSLEGFDSLHPYSRRMRAPRKPRKAQ